MSKSIKHFDDEAKYVGVQKERFFIYMVDPIW